MAAKEISASTIQSTTRINPTDKLATRQTNKSSSTKRASNFRVGQKGIKGVKLTDPNAKVKLGDTSVEKAGNLKINHDAMSRLYAIS